MEFDKSLLSIPTVEILKELLGKDRHDLCKLFLRTTFFIKPEKVWAKPVVYPEWVRTSKVHFPGKVKGNTVEVDGKVLKIWDNKKARDAFANYSKLKLNSSSREVEKGWEVAHIWGRVFDPQCFTAGWNFCLIPNFLRDLTEEQNGNHFFQDFMKAISYEYYFKPEASTLPNWDFIKKPEVELEEYIGDLKPHFL